MAGVKRYRALWAWQTGDQFKLQVFGLVRSSPEASRDFKFRDQLRGAARSVPANIAEGFLRHSPGDLMRFLDYAIASLAEAELHLRDGIQLGYFEPEACEEAFVLARRCMTAAVRLKQSQKRYLENQNHRGNPPKRPLPGKRKMI
jgi:four helix bundle protein